MLLTACQLPTASGASKSKKAEASEPALVPFGSLTTDPEADAFAEGGMGSIPDTIVSDTTQPEPEIIEADAEAEEEAPPAPTTTSPSKNPICKAARRVVSLSATIDKTLLKAVSMTSASRLVRTLRGMPVTDLRNAYDDLSAELNIARRRKLAVVRDFVVDVGMALVRVTSIQSLSNTMGNLEGDKRAENAAINNRALSSYIKGKCDFPLKKVGDTLKG
jgi:hypothetical protein